MTGGDDTNHRTTPPRYVYIELVRRYI
jgi:hypothetical protein